MTREEIEKKIKKEFSQMLAEEQIDVLKYIQDLKRRRE